MGYTSPGYVPRSTGRDWTCPTPWCGFSNEDGTISQPVTMEEMPSMRPPQLVLQFSLVAPWAGRARERLRGPPGMDSGDGVGSEAAVLVPAPIERSERGNDPQRPTNPAG